MLITLSLFQSIAPFVSPPFHQSVFLDGDLGGLTGDFADDDDDDDGFAGVARAAGVETEAAAAAAGDGDNADDDDDDDDDDVDDDGEEDDEEEEVGDGFVEEIFMLPRSLRWTKKRSSFCVIELSLAFCLLLSNNCSSLSSSITCFLLTKSP